MKKFAIFLIGFVLVTALLAFQSSANAAGLCSSIHSSSASSAGARQVVPLRILRDSDVQSFVTSNDELDLLLVSNVHETLVYRKSTLQKMGTLPASMSSGHPRILPQLGAIAALNGRGEFLILDLKTQQLKSWNVLNLLWNQILFYDISEDGKTLAVLEGSNYKVFDVPSRTLIASGSGQAISNLKLLKNGRELAMVRNSTLIVTDLRSGAIVSQSEPGAIDGSAMDLFSEDGRLFGTRQFNPNFSSLIDVKSGLKIGQVPSQITSFSADGRWVAVNMGTRTRIYDTETQILIAELTHSEMHWSSHFSQDNRKFYVSLRDGSVLEYNLVGF